VTASTVESGSPAAALTLSLIHDFELWWGGQPVRMSPSSQRLVGFVALHERPVRRAKASGQLWLDSTDDRASASLRSALWRTPAPGGVPVLAASNTHLWLDPRVEVDFRAVTARAQALLDDASPSAEVVDVARELCCLNDDLLPGWDDDWVIMERERFHHLRLQALDRMGERLRALGRTGDALQVGLAAVHAEPLRETAHRLVIRVHLDQGNVAEAIRQYRAYERLLAQELGAVPSSVVRTLIEPYLRACRETSPAPRSARTRVAGRV
jgi:DNA-binding SARP family transcriptional activator